jgi:hypothetical protein
MSMALIFRATRSLDGCPDGPMNRNAGCEESTPLHFTLSYDPADNPGLPAGTYNGMVSFEARDSDDADYVIPIHAIISIDNVSPATAAQRQSDGKR